MGERLFQAVCEFETIHLISHRASIIAGRLVEHVKQLNYCVSSSNEFLTIRPMAMDKKGIDFVYTL